jgi:hypothetical protein
LTVVAARWLVRIRRRTRPWLNTFSSLLPQRAERELFSLLVRYLERRSLARYGTWAPDSVSRERAAALLAQHLTTAQRHSLRKRGFFMVTSNSGRRFRVWARRQLPVELIDRSAASARCHKPWLYCIHTDFAEVSGILPLSDYLLELKLCLEAAEEHFLVTANPNFERGRVEKNELLRKRGALEIAHGEAVRQPDYSEVVGECIETYTH